MGKTFEHKMERIAPFRVFLKRLLVYFGISSIFIAVALIIGVSGYHWIAGLDWPDALLDASMTLSGMGPVSPLSSTAGKIFAAVFALFSGLIFVLAMGIVLSPLVHRLLHVLHVEMKENEKANEEPV